MRAPVEASSLRVADLADRAICIVLTAMGLAVVALIGGFAVKVWRWALAPVCGV